MTALSNPGGRCLVRDQPGPAGARGCRICGALAVAVADRMSGHPPGAGTTLTVMLFSNGRAGLAQRQRLPRVPDSRRLARQITNDHRIGMLVWAADLLALVLARHLDGRPDRRADMVLRADGRYLQCTGRLSLVVDDRPQRNVLISVPYPPRRRPAGRPSSRPASVSRLTPYRCAGVQHAGQAGSRLPLSAEDARPQISRDTGSREMPGGTSAAAFVPDAPGRIGVPSP